MKTVLILLGLLLCCGVTSNTACASEGLTVQQGNIFFRANQLTTLGKDVNPALSPDGQTIIFVREIKKIDYGDNDPGFILFSQNQGATEIWLMNADGSGQRSIIKGNQSLSVDSDNFLGWFDSLCFSKDGKKIYFLSQNSLSSANLWMADSDGRNVRKIMAAHQLDVVGGDLKDEYFGDLVVSSQVSKDAKPLEWKSFLMDSNNGEIIEAVADLESFWKKHKKVSDE